MTRVLVAGVGNIFLGDDGFGSAVIGALAGRPVPPGVDVVDFGIRGVHLAYQLLDGYDVLVIVDAAPRGDAPGTVSLLAVDPAPLPSESPPLDAHGMEPATVLALLGSLGETVEKVLVVACEPATVEPGIGLSDVVAAAVPGAVAMTEDVVRSEYAREVTRCR